METNTHESIAILFDHSQTLNLELHFLNICVQCVCMQLNSNNAAFVVIVSVSGEPGFTKGYRGHAGNK